MKQRILYLDVAKAVAICLVCIGHSSSLVPLARPSVLLCWIYSFHMPLFMLLSGFFSKHALETQFPVFIKNKIFQLLVPAIFIPFLTVITCWLIGGFDIPATARAEAIGGMWFLKTLFACFLYVWLVRRIPFSDVCQCLLSILVACLVPHGYFLQFNWMLIFFWIGFFLNKYRNLYKHSRSVVTVLSIAFYICFGRHAAPILLTYDNMIFLPQVIIWQLFTALSASLGVIGILYYICKFCHGKVLGKIGKIGYYTLGIYGLQSIILQRIFLRFIHLDVTLYPFWIGDFVITPLLGILAMVVCYWLVLWLKRYRIANILLFGGQYK